MSETTPADRRAAYDLVHAGIVAELPIRLPIPMGIYLYQSRALILDFYPDDRDAVDRWAAWLVGSTYTTGLHGLDALPGWLVNVSCPAPRVEVPESDR